jgi:type III secretion protein J
LCIKKRLDRAYIDLVPIYSLARGEKSIMKKLKSLSCYILALFLLTSCSESRVIVTGVEERQANVIVVFLESRGIMAKKEAAKLSPSAGMDSSAAAKFDISVDGSQAIDAMAILNSNGLPHRKGTDLLELFAKSGMMSTDKEETIRYQAGLAQQIANMILMIDGVIDANVQISFPQEQGIGEGGPTQRVTAAIFVKHQGIIDDPNSHLETKIKRLVSGSIQGLDINDVTVVSDRSRFTDVSIDAFGESMGSKGKEYVRIWSIVMDKESAAKFRFIFTFLLIIAILLAMVMGFVIWKMYPTIRGKGGFIDFFNPIPLFRGKETESHPPSGEGE